MTTNPQGSSWNKWDLHVHTPDSIVHHYAGPDVWDRYIDELSKLPPEIKVLGINDYIFLDGYKKVLEAKEAGKLPNIELLLPVIELRLNKFGGSRNKLSRVNYHVIFSDEVSPDTIESQFLATLRSKYILTPEINALVKTGKWTGVPTLESLHDLGQAIIDSVPEKERDQYETPIQEGFNNLCCSLDDITKALDTPYFEGRVLTAIGKTEWADVKWTGQSIAEKKSIINGADFVFISAESEEAWRHAKDSLTESGVNDLLLDCSDAHRYPDSDDKDRLGKCYTWIKGDLCFETLRQARFEPGSRICVSDHAPLKPPIRFEKAVFDFPKDSLLRSEHSSSPFCLRGKHEVYFSPYLTCLIGGRGSGKSTILNLIHEKIKPGDNQFFKANRLESLGVPSIADCVEIDDGKGSYGEVEFIQQNEVERLALHPEHFTQAIFSRLNKLDTDESLKNARNEVATATQGNGLQRMTLKKYFESERLLSSDRKDLATSKKLTESFEDADYIKSRETLSEVVKELQKLKAGKKRLFDVWNNLKTLTDEVDEAGGDQDTPYDQAIQRILEAVKVAHEELRTSAEKEAGDERVAELEQEEKAINLKIDKFLRARGLSQENLQDVGKASKRIAELEQSISDRESKMTETKKKIGAFSFSLEAVEKYKRQVSECLDPINEILANLGSQQVKPIRLEYRFDSEGADIAIIRELTDMIKEAFEITIREDHVANVLSDIKLIDVDDHEDFLVALRDEGKTGEAVRDYLSVEGEYRDFVQLVRIQYLNVQDYQRISVYYDGRPIESSSFGQRCTAAIVVLLLLGNTPIIIDEPEAHLDSSLIARYLVNLVKDKKQQRQIIFATHNANFVINGDAELIHILEASEDGITKAESTTIENLKYRDRLLALEGGHEAFKQREKRYGI